MKVMLNCTMAMELHPHRCHVPMLLLKQYYKNSGRTDYE